MVTKVALSKPFSWQAGSVDTPSIRKANSAMDGGTPPAQGKSSTFVLVEVFIAVGSWGFIKLL